ncbi:TetR family transcriptional regulator [Streptomyces spiroverticillatus]|uniref:TetR family transcriptional regulator n=1 Tax=Streptomyces finlayi TaxID=67296 RepID=A0A919C821_9ACTN|nr:TetR family transcriptional regulator [Streptomyces finlayi]GGZ97071.1 TetR family transcriptional regulator [Streptomyces spiroverticillatus]GHC82296.1 TetR family transcriptional regulator [Streptomyces finlayi]
MSGLRELKKQRTYEAISDAAVALFLERGFDAVSVAEVAAAAEVSKPTLFRYFPAKEDLALYRFADHEDESARVVRAGREEGVGALDALERHLLERLAARDPITGLCDDPGVLAYQRMLYGTPSLETRLFTYLRRSEAVLAEAIGEGLRARLAAGQIGVVLRVLALENWRRIESGESADAVHADAVTEARDAFRRLREGLDL